MCACVCVCIHSRNNGENILPVLVDFMTLFNHKIAPLALTTKDYQHVEKLILIHIRWCILEHNIIDMCARQEV